MKLAFPPLTPVVRATVIVLFASFVIQTLCFAFAGIQLFDVLALQYDLGIGTAWQWATHVLVEMPVNGAVITRALSLLFIYFWITPFEQQFDRNKTLTLVGLAIVGGAVLPFLFGIAASLSGIAGPGSRLLLAYSGAGAISWAGLAALAIRTRGAPMNMVLLPTMNAWTLAAIFLVIEALQCAWAGTPVPLLGSVGGFVVGILYTRWLERPKPVKKVPPKRRAGASHLHVIPGGQSDDDRPRWLN